jgi:anti-sigma factor RsiW
MACAPEWVTAYVDGELDLASRLTIESHLAGCRCCTAQVGGERTVRFRLRTLSEPRLPLWLERRSAPRHGGLSN